MTTKQLGLLGELKAQYDFIKYGFEVCVPQGDYTPYDLLVKKDDRFFTIQVKTRQAESKEDIISFGICSRHYTNNHASYSQNDCDWFYLFDIATEQSFLLKNEDHLLTNVTFRYTPTKNGQVKGIRYAKDYLFSEQIKYLESSIPMV